MSSLANNDIRSFPSSDWMVRAKLSQASFASKTPPKGLRDINTLDFLIILPTTVDGETDLVSKLIKIPFSSCMTESLKSSCVKRGGWI